MGTYYESSHSYELIFSADFQVNSLFTKHVLTAFKPSPLASIYYRSSISFFKKEDSENAVFEVSLDGRYHSCYPRWNRWVVWRAALEPALNGLIELIVHNFYEYNHKNDISAMIHNNNTNFTLTKLCEEVKISYPIPFTDFITHSHGDKVILVLVGDFNAFKYLAVFRI